jgi:hypothetical protein
MRRIVVLPFILLVPGSSALAEDIAPRVSAPTGYESTLVGLLDVPTIYGAAQENGARTATTAVAFDVRREPLDGASVVARLDDAGIARSDGARCFWRSAPRCRYHESGYEIPALAVFDTRTGGWYRIAIDPEGAAFGWIRSAEPFHALAALVLSDERLTYLTPLWRGVLHPRPADPTTRLVTRESETPYRALRPATIGNQLWIEVEIVADACKDRERVIDRGWVPLRNAAGELNVWYWPRGC